MADDPTVAGSTRLHWPLAPLWITALIVVTLAAAGIRFSQAGEGLWLDELHTAWVVSGPAEQLGLRARIGNQSPLYFQLVRRSLSWFGGDEVALRLPSLLAGIALVPLVGWLTLRWTREPGAALTAAALVAIDRYCIFYAQEARPYAMVQLVGLMQMICFAQLLGGASLRWRVGFVAATILLFHLHYTSILLVPAEIVAFGIYGALQRRSLNYRPTRFALDLSLCALGWTPALWHVWEVAGQRENWALMVRKPPLRSLVTTFALHIYVLPPLAVLVIGRLWCRMRTGHWARCIVRERDSVPVPGESVVAARPVCRAGAIQQKPWVLAVCWLCVPLLAAWLLTHLDVARLFMARYLMIMAVAPAIVSALLLAAVPQRGVRAAAALLVIAALAHHTGLMRQWLADGRFHADRNQDWRGAVAYVQQDTLRADWPVLVRSGFLEADRLRDDPSLLLRAYCLAPVTAMYRLDVPPRPLIPLPTRNVGALSSRALSELRGQRGVWVLINGAAGYRGAIERQILASLAGAGMPARTDVRETFGNILVLRMAMHADGADAALGRAEPD